MRPLIRVNRSAGTGTNTRPWSLLSLAAAVACPAVSAVASGAELLSPDLPIAAAVDHYIDQTLAQRQLTPAPQAPDAVLLRRTMLDLAGRIPTSDELQEYSASTDPEKRARLVDQLMQSPAYVRHGAREFDRLLRAENESAPSVEPYLTTAIRERRPWDRMLAELFGVSAEPNDEAARFVTGRLGDRDALTRDVSSVVFGINVSCCQCHQHPSVDYLSQEFYFGLKAFFHRSYEFHGRLLERSFAEPVRFKPRDGEEQPARLLLLTGTAVEAPLTEVENLKTAIEEEDRAIAARREKFSETKVYPALPAFIGRAALIETALRPDQRQLLARAMVNRLWYRLSGYGLVMRVDQMHPENPPSHPELLEWLTRDFIAHEYDLHRLIREFLLSRTYARSSAWTAADGPEPEPQLFAVAAVRALTPMQYAVSLRVASQPDLLSRAISPEPFDQNLIRLEDEARRTLAPLFADPIEGLQIGVDEALRLSNDPELQKVLGDGLVSRLLPDPNAAEQIDQLFATVLSRSASPDERAALMSYLQESGVSNSASAVAAQARLTERQQQFADLQQRLLQQEETAKLAAVKAVLNRTAEYLAVAAEQYRSPASDAARTRLEELGAHDVVYQNWRRYLALDRDAPDSGDTTNPLKNLFVEKMEALSGHQQVVGLGTPQTPSVVVNLSDQPVQLFSFAYPPQRITMHPSPTQQVIAGWRSPISGVVHVRCRLRDLDVAGGNGFGVTIQRVQADTPQQLLAAEVTNGGTIEFRTDQQWNVSPGDTLAVFVDALAGNHGFDSTEVDLVISEVSGASRVWDINGDVVPTILENPHADRYGHAGVWHFAMSGQPASLAPGGSLLDTWTRRLRQNDVNEPLLSELSQRVQQLLTGDAADGASQADTVLRSQLTAANGPLFSAVDIADLYPEPSRSELAALRAQLKVAEPLSQEILTEAERSEIDRLRGTLHQLAWALLTSAEFRFNH